MSETSVLDPKLVPTLDRLGAPIGGYQIKVGDFVLATFHYEYPFTDNATVRQHAEICFTALFPTKEEIDGRTG